MQALTSVREHPEWFFPGRQFEISELVGLLATECLRSGVRDLAVEHLGDWLLIASSKDWLDGDVTGFLRLQPYGSASHSSRVEVVATAFCLATVTAARGERYEVRLDAGTEIPPAVAERLDDPLMGRVLAVLPPSIRGEQSVARPPTEPLAAPDRSSRFRVVQGGGERVAAGVRSLSEKLRT